METTNKKINNGSLESKNSLNIGKVSIITRSSVFMDKFGFFDFLVEINDLYQGVKFQIPQISNQSFSFIVEK
jgi:hypothetical protein